MQSRLGQVIAFGLTAFAVGVGARGDTGRVGSTEPGAAEIRVLEPRRGVALTAGETVVVSWSRLPARAEEMELLLTLDDGSATTIRLTPELAPDLRSHHWVVPNLPSREARIRLRFGAGGEEVETGPSEPFEIRGSAALPTGEISFARGEWWLGRAPVRAVPDTPREASLGVPVPPGPELQATGTSRSDGAPVPGEPARPTVQLGPATLDSEAAGAGLLRRPLSAPRRE